MNENLNQPARKFPGPVRHGYQVEANAGKNPKLTARKSRPDRCKKRKMHFAMPAHCTAKHGTLHFFIRPASQFCRKGAKQHGYAKAASNSALPKTQYGWQEKLAVDVTCDS
ncbi:MAG: hypothetical protein ABUS47_10325 [Steroidobacter sp.]